MTTEPQSATEPVTLDEALKVLRLVQHEVLSSHAEMHARYCESGVIDARKAVNSILERSSRIPAPTVAPEVDDGISWTALLSVLERLRSNNRNPANEWYHGWNAAIQCLINDIKARSATPRSEAGSVAGTVDGFRRELAFYFGAYHGTLSHRLDATSCMENECVRVRQLLHAPAAASPVATVPEWSVEHPDREREYWATLSKINPTVAPVEQSGEDGLRAALQDIASQRLRSEIEPIDGEISGDFEGAYDIMIVVARDALAAAPLAETEDEARGSKSTQSD